LIAPDLDTSMSANATSPITPIKLTIINGSHMDEVISMWDADLQFDSSKLPLLASNKNPFYKYLVKNIAPDPIRSIFAAVRKRFGAFGLFEGPYMDLEFWDSHIGFYGYSFMRYPLECQRLHFFSGDEAKANALKELLESGKSEQEIYSELDVSYTGYCVLRPTPSYVVGRTAIKFDNSAPDEVRSEVQTTEAEKKGLPYLKSFQCCKANLLNASFEIITPEFVQQDPNLGLCATASLWVSTNLMARNFGTNHFRYGKITRQANSSTYKEPDINLIYDSLSDEKGLSISEIINALGATGATPLVITPSSTETPEQTFSRLSHEIYSFSESGFPVLLCIENEKTLDGHVVTVVGHLLPLEFDKPNILPASVFLERTATNELAGHYLLSNIVKSYYVHDDSYGPFNRVELLNDFKSMSLQNGQCEPIVKVRIGRLQNDRSIFNLKAALIPVPVPVRNLAWRQMSSLLVRFNRDWGSEFQKNNPSVIFIWRSLLISGSEFKRSLSIRKYSDNLKRWYAKLHLPKYIWLYELSLDEAESVNRFFPKNGKRMIYGEYLFDATSPNTDVTLIAERIGGYFRDYSMQIDTYNEDKNSHEAEYECYYDFKEELAYAKMERSKKKVQGN